MTEQHVCDWTPDILGARCSCGRALSKDGLIKRANEYETLKKATEALSAKDAVRLANALDDIAVAWDGKDAGGGTKRLRTYADILRSPFESWVADILEGK